MQKLITLLVAIFTVVTATAQIERYTPRMLATGNLPQENKGEDVQRNFIEQKWRSGTVIFTGSTNPVEVPLLFDAYSNKLYYRHNGSIMEFNQPIKEFSISIVNKDTINLLYRNAYPAIHKNTAETFYEVLVDGGFHLLKCKAKTIGLYKDQDVPEGERKLTKDLLYAFLPDKRIIQVKKDKDYLLNAMPAYATSIQQICAGEKLKLKNENQLKELFVLLNK